MEPASPYDGYASDSGLGSALRDVSGRAVCPVQKADGSEDEVIARTIFCSRHGRKRIPYSQMITMAIMDSPNWRMTLSEIYEYTSSHFPPVMFRRNWQNSIRHMLSISSLFVKTQRSATRNAHYWSVVPALMDFLQEHLSSPTQWCCRWQLVNHVQRYCVRVAPRGPRLPCHGHPLRAPARRATRNKSPSPQKKDNRSPPSSSRNRYQVRIPPAEGRRKLERPKSPASIAGTSGDELEYGREVFLGPAPPLKPLIARAIMLSPYRHVPLSVIFAFCVRHCPYYRSRRRQCQAAIAGILDSEACFRRVPRDDNRPDYWTLDTQYKDLLEHDTCQPPGDIVSPNPWEHDHGLYPKQLESDPDRANDGGRDTGRVDTPDSQVTDTASERGSDTDEAQGRLVQERLQSSPADTGLSVRGARKRDRSTADGDGSEHGCSPKRPSVCGPGLEPLPRPDRLHSDYRDPDKPFDVNDLLDIKEEPFPEEEVPMGNIYAKENRKQRRNRCTTLLNADCYGRVQIKQEKDDYPVTVKYEMVDTWC